MLQAHRVSSSPDPITSSDDMYLTGVFNVPYYVIERCVL